MQYRLANTYIPTHTCMCTYHSEPHGRVKSRGTSTTHAYGYLPSLSRHDTFDGLTRRLRPPAPAVLDLLDERERLSTTARSLRYAEWAYNHDHDDPTRSTQVAPQHEQGDASYHDVIRQSWSLLAEERPKHVGCTLSGVQTKRYYFAPLKAG